MTEQELDKMAEEYAGPVAKEFWEIEQTYKKLSAQESDPPWWALYCQFQEAFLAGARAAQRWIPIDECKKSGLYAYLYRYGALVEALGFIDITNRYDSRTNCKIEYYMPLPAKPEEEKV